MRTIETAQKESVIGFSGQKIREIFGNPDKVCSVVLDNRIQVFWAWYGSRVLQYENGVEKLREKEGRTSIVTQILDTNNLPAHRRL